MWAALKCNCHCKNNNFNRLYLGNKASSRPQIKCNRVLRPGIRSRITFQRFFGESFDHRFLSILALYLYRKIWWFQRMDVFTSKMRVSTIVFLSSKQPQKSRGACGSVFWSIYYAFCKHFPKKRVLHFLKINPRRLKELSWKWHHQIPRFLLHVWE